MADFLDYRARQYQLSRRFGVMILGTTMRRIFRKPECVLRLAESGPRATTVAAALGLCRHVTAAMREDAAGLLTPRSGVL